jgi:plastocyanin
MSTPLVVPQTQAWRQLPTLRKVMIAGLVGNVVVLTVQQILQRTLIPPLAIILALTLIVAGICLTRWRWAPHLAALWCVLSVIPGLQPYTYSLTHPAEIITFIATLLGLSLLLVTVVAGVAAISYGDRQVAEGRAPRWLRGFLIGVTTFAFGATLVAMIPQAEAAAGVSPETLAQLPALRTAHYQFDQPEIRAKVGQTVALRLENNDAGAHSFDINDFNVHAPMPAGKPALALFTPSQPGTYTFYCGIPGHMEAGMVGKLIVAP